MFVCGGEGEQQCMLPSLWAIPRLKGSQRWLWAPRTLWRAKAIPVSFSKTLFFSGVRSANTTPTWARTFSSPNSPRELGNRWLKAIYWVPGQSKIWTKDFPASSQFLLWNPTLCWTLKVKLSLSCATVLFDRTFSQLMKSILYKLLNSRFIHL